MDTNKETAREAVVSDMKMRVAEHLTSNLSDVDCVAVCIAAALQKDGDDVIAVLLNNNTVKRARLCVQELAIRTNEWNVFFGSCAVGVKEEASSLVAADDKVKQRVSYLLAVVVLSYTCQFRLTCKPCMFESRYINSLVT